MVESKLKFLSLIRTVLMLIFGVAFSVLSALTIKILALELDLTGLIGLLFFTGFSFVALYISLGTIRIIKIREETGSIRVQRMSFITEEYDNHRIMGSKYFTLVNKWGSYRGCFFEVMGGNQIQFTELDFMNFTEVRKAVMLIAARNNLIKRKYWLFGNKNIGILTMVIMGVIWFTVLF